MLTDLTEALRDGDAERLVGVLAPDVTFTSDGAGEVSASLRVLEGVDQVSGFLLGLSLTARRNEMSYEFEPVLVNGDPGFVVHVDSPRPHDPHLAVYSYVIRDGVITAIHAVLAPDKITRAVPPGLTRPQSRSARSSSVARHHAPFCCTAHPSRAT